MNLTTQPASTGQKVGHANELPRALRVDRFCELYGIGKTSAFKLIKEGKVKSLVIAGRRLIITASAEALLKTEDV